MAAVIIPEGYAQVEVHFRQADTGKRCSNTFGVKVPTPLTQSDVNTLSTSLAAAYKPILHTGSVYDGIRVLEGASGPALVWESASGAGAGSRTVTNRTTPQVQFMVEKRTALSGRQFRGRTFHVDVGETDVDATGAIAGSVITLLTTFADAVMAALVAGTYDGMVILHTDSTTPTVVTSYIPDALVATLRRRYSR